MDKNIEEAKEWDSGSSDIKKDYERMSVCLKTKEPTNKGEKDNPFDLILPKYVLDEFGLKPGDVVLHPFGGRGYVRICGFVGLIDAVANVGISAKRATEALNKMIDVHNDSIGMKPIKKKKNWKAKTIWERVR